MSLNNTRRGFLATAGALIPAIPLTSLSPQTRARIKVTDVRLVNLRVVKEIGSMEPAWNLGSQFSFRIGGGSILEIRTDQGLTGIAHPCTADSIPAIREYLVGKDPFEAESHFFNLARSLKNPNAAPCVEIALWDIIGKACGEPLYKLWGGGRDRVPAYASLAKLSTPEERAEMAVRLRDEGWPAIKLRQHYPTMREDLRVVEAVRKAVGDDWVLMTDANQSFPVRMGIEWDYKRALETARAMDQLKCYWLEEPLKKEDLSGQAELCRQVKMAIAGGEVHRDLGIFAEIVKQDAFDILNPETLSIGISGIRKVSAMAELCGKPVVPHNGGMRIGTIVHLHLIASWKHAPYIEIIHDPPVGSYLHNFEIFTNPPKLDKDGCLPVPQGPGLGVEINPDLIEK